MPEPSSFPPIVAPREGGGRPYAAAVAPTAPWPVAAIAAAAALPFAIGRLGGGLVVGDGATLAGHVLCPFRAATGVPCPLCGATRSVVLFSQGDVTFLQYNPVWVVVLLGLVVLGTVLVVTGLAGRTGLLHRRPRPAVVRAVVGACLVAGWACSLLHRQAITGA
jgi:hypothetical protein